MDRGSGARQVVRQGLRQGLGREVTGGCLLHSSACVCHAADDQEVPSQHCFLKPDAYGLTLQC